MVNLASASASTPNTGIRALALRSSWLVDVSRVTQQQRCMSSSRSKCTKVLPGPISSRAASTGADGLSVEGSAPNSKRRKAAKPAPREERLTVLTKKLNIKVSPSKLNPIAHLVAGMPVLTALDNLRFMKKRASADYMMVLNSALERADSLHGLKVDQLIIGQTWVVKGQIKKQVDVKARGKAGIERTKHAHLFVLLQESRRASRQRLGREARIKLAAETESETLIMPPPSISPA